MTYIVDFRDHPACPSCDNEGGPRGATNTAEGLTHSSGTSREGLAMKATQTESWRPVVGYEGTHEVSNLGRVRRLDRMVFNYPSKRRIFAQGRMLTANLSGPYPRVALVVDGAQRVVPIHRLVTAAFLGPCPQGLEVCHGNGDPQDNCLSNLRYDTHSANNWDQVRHGTHAQASKTHCPQGHPYDESNTLVGAGSRRCRICRTASLRKAKARYRAKLKAAS